MGESRTLRAPTRLAATVSRLRAVIRQQHEAGARRLPPETVLSRQLGVGRSTLREALARLETEGIVARRRRTGTAITWGPPGLRYPAGLILALSDFLRQSGIPYDVQALTCRRRPASAAIAAALRCPPGTPVFGVSRVYVVDRRPAAYLEHYLPTSLGGRRVQIERFTDAAVTFLEEVQGVRLHDVRSVITAESADRTLAGALAIPVGAAVMVMYTTLYDGGGQVVSLGRMVFRPDAVALTVTAHGHLRLAKR
jgi:GntR family transcriptional regulator